MNTSCIPSPPKKSCINGPELALQAARAAAKSADRAEDAAAQAEATAQNVTPYIGPNGNWWRGDTDLGYPAAGTPGKTPYIGENGNWWVGDVDLGVYAGGGGIGPAQLEEALATRTTIVEVTQDQLDQLTLTAPTIYIITNNQ